MYAVIELQKTKDNLAILKDSFASRQAAESKYHTVLAAAAISSVLVHSCILLDEEALPIKRDCYIHEETPEE